MDLSEAKDILNGCFRSELRDHAFGDTEVYWIKDGIEIGTGYFLLGLIGGMADVSVLEGDNWISFHQEEARELRNCGTEDIIDRNDETGPDTFVEGQVMPGLTKEAVFKELNMPPPN